MSLSHLLFHFIHCKQALFYIVGTISKLLTVDYVMAFINRPSVTRILMKYIRCVVSIVNVYCISEGDSGF